MNVRHLAPLHLACFRENEAGKSFLTVVGSLVKRWGKTHGPTVCSYRVSKEAREGTVQADFSGILMYGTAALPFPSSRLIPNLLGSKKSSSRTGEKTSAQTRRSRTDGQ